MTLPKTRSDYERENCTIAAEVRRLQAENERLRKDADRLDFVGEEFLYLEPFTIPTGEGDADIGWRVMQHHCCEPTPRVMAESFTESVRQAIDAARSAK